MLPRLLSLLALLLTVVSVRADVTTKPLIYNADGVVYEGVILADDALKVRRPGVILAHPGGASSPDARSRAGQLAKLGYVVLSLDLYGKGVTAPKSRDEAAKLAGILPKDRKAIRTKAAAAYEAFIKEPLVDSRHLAAVGFGVGGTAVLELARAGVDLEGLCIIHGELSSPMPTDYKAFQPNVTVLVGADDPYIREEQIKAFSEEMKKAEVDCLVTRYPGTVHDFTNLLAGKNLKSGSAYNPDSEKKSSDAVRAMLETEVPIKFAPAKSTTKAEIPKGIPEKALKVLKYVDENADAPEGYEGGRNFLNIERQLAQSDKSGRRIKYREWDVNPLRKGVNRGAERLVTGSDGTAYYTDDHYKSFKKIR